MMIPWSRLVITPGAEKTFTPEERRKAINKFVERDWGDLEEQDKMLNDLAVEYGERLLGIYQFRSKELWITTETDGSVITMLLLEEY